jgi:nucleotide-binding universal stress UspA family protein
MYYGATGDPFVPTGIDTEALWRGLKEHLDSSLTTEFGSLRVERYAELGDPAHVITDYAHTHHVDLIMMPTHGYGLFRQFLIGSVTAKVLHDSGKLVWTSAHVQDPIPLVHLDIRNILCAADATPKSEELICRAADFAVGVAAKMRLVHVIPASPGWPDRQLNADFESALIKEAREEIGKMEASLHLDIPLCVAKGEVAPTVHEIAERFGSDLVIIGRGVMKERLGRLRTNAYAIIRQSPCPVLSF